MAADRSTDGDGPLDFHGRVVVVTGGGRGIGRAVTEAFLAAGADAVVCGRTELAGGDLPTATDAGGTVRTAGFVAADVRDPDQAAAVVAAAVDRHGRVDVLVNNAGGSPYVDAATASPRFLASVVTLNLLAPLYCAQAANAVMQDQEDGGSIVNIASVSGMRPSPGTAAYGAAKAGLLNLTQHAGRRMGPEGAGQRRERRPGRHRRGRRPLRRAGRRGRGGGHRADGAVRHPGGHGRDLPLPGLPPGRLRDRRQRRGPRRRRAPGVPHRRRAVRRR